MTQTLKAVLCTFVACCFIGAFSAQAGPPSAPKLSVEMTFIDPTNIDRLFWDVEDPDDVEGYRVYWRVYDWETETATDWELFRDEIEEQELTLGHDDLADGLMSFYVTAYNEDAESDRSNGVSITMAGRIIADQDYIEILLNEGVLALVVPAPQEANEGESYMFDADAVAEVLRQVAPMPNVRYELSAGPDGMEINETSGQLVWNNPTQGEHTITLNVVDVDASEVLPHTWTLEVSGAVSVRETDAFPAAVVFPNPATDAVSLRFNATDVMTRVRIINAAGVEIHTQTLVTLSGATTVNITTQGFASGAYYVQLIGASGTRTLPMTITR